MASINSLIESEISRISQPELIQAIRAHTVKIRIENREWDYSSSFTECPCYIVLEDKKTNTAVAYCDHGFGPVYPWGLIFITGPHMSLGMDSNWFASLEDAVRNSMFWDGENPINYEMQ